MIKTSPKPKKLLSIFLGLFIGTALAVSPGAISQTVYAAEGDDKAKDNTCQVDKDGRQVNPDPTKPCIPKDDLDSTPDPAAKTCTGGDCSGLIKKYVNPFIRLLSVLVGIIVAISIVVGGVQYSSASGDPSKVNAAKKRITNAILALLAYLFMFAFLQWLLPGGIV